ncbi:integral membrane protein [Aspergillus uvarum CBS 121591]|uniref:Integral membrane protein n=1 Tax=Aspergillus uvarum CBS 121591 TaxID=1448315 RepID=A0A319CMN6_9EURO|nr:integral membrane protein [Aspergillus uvarum CBS 121591]PYH85659.1 integral membrane protein [Aspergillus uvarum CBS 121591]
MRPSQDTLPPIVSDKVLHHEEHETGSLPPASVTLLRQRRKLHVINPLWYRNSLLASVGFLEFANAGDFAANVWNDVPVPLYAIIFMAIGGPLALLISGFAVRDSVLSWQNVRILQRERKYLKSLQAQHLECPAPDATTLRFIDRRLGVSHRELGTELVDRIVMDVFLGIGGLLVGTGTIMAIWGSDRHVYFISNLLSGFVGNSFAAIYGIINAIWSAYLAWRFHSYDRACSRAGAMLAPFRDRLQRRFQCFKWHAVASGWTGLIAGGASMMTSRLWEGYVVLIPCMLLEVACNRFWRGQLGYDRPIVAPDSPLHRGILVPESPYSPASSSNNSNSSSPQLGYPKPTIPVAHHHKIEQDTPNIHPEDAEKEDDRLLLDALTSVIGLQTALMPILPSTLVLEDVDWTSLDSLLLFIVNNHLFDCLCDWLATNPAVPKDFRHRVFRLATNPSFSEITVTLADLRHLSDVEDRPRMLEMCQVFLRTEAQQVMINRERYLLEMVGYTIWKND